MIRLRQVLWIARKKIYQKMRQTRKRAAVASASEEEPPAKVSKRYGIMKNHSMLCGVMFKADKKTTKKSPKPTKTAEETSSVNAHRIAIDHCTS